MAFSNPLSEAVVGAAGAALEELEQCEPFYPEQHSES
jgi:hypothetical protein